MSITDIDPTKYYMLVTIMDNLAKDGLEDIVKFTAHIHDSNRKFDDEVKSLSNVCDEMDRETRFASKKRGKDNNWRSILDEEDFNQISGFDGIGNNFIRIMLDIMINVQHGCHHLESAARGLKPKPLIRSSNRWESGKLPDTFEEIQRMTFEMQLNSKSLLSLLEGLAKIQNFHRNILQSIRFIVARMDSYYQLLVKRHSSEGIKIHEDPISTDLAISIYDNVDSHGEIESGSSPNEVSAYTVNKAVILTHAVKHESLGNFIRYPNQFIIEVKHLITKLWDNATQLVVMTQKWQEEINAIFDLDATPTTRIVESLTIERDHLFNSWDDLDVMNIVYKEKSTLLTAEERFNLKFRNETIAKLVKLIHNDEPPKAIVDYILARKQELRKFFQEENSFYVCRVGSGNPFSNESPGTLTVVPGARPVVNLDEVRGSGFDEVKKFFSQIGIAAKWHDLFVATSPSRTADKSNVLLCGPQGSGKSEILRAVGGDRGSIGVFAQGSDFLTCWKGEAEKNPKRLFESAVKLQRESNRHVHILIDEIDTILNGSMQRESFGATNLTTEFQILMDGIVQYPHISVWGATNHPEVIPMPMIRRFSKVLIVGELTQEDRIWLLQHFANFMPVAPITDEQWSAMAHKLEGATGDVIRKIVDQVWRDKMVEYVATNPSAAENVVKFLNADEKFNIASFNQEKRKSVHDVLQQHVAITAADIDSAIDEHLNTLSIHSEIQSAIESYERAKRFLESVKSRKTNGKMNSMPAVMPTNNTDQDQQQD